MLLQRRFIRMPSRPTLTRRFIGRRMLPRRMATITVPESALALGTDTTTATTVITATTVVTTVLGIMAVTTEDITNGS